jgi:invasion protein IalB
MIHSVHRGARACIVAATLILGGSTIALALMDRPDLESVNAPAAQVFLAQAQPAAPSKSAPPAAKSAPAATPAAAASGDQRAWVVNCAAPPNGGPSRCTMLQNLAIKSGEQQNRLLTVLIQQQAGSADYVLLLSLPHGLFLPAGAQIQVDEGKPEKIVIQTSDATGSYAGTKLTPELLASLRGGQSLKVSILSADQKGITIPVTLAGFGPTYDELMAKK